MGGSRNSGGRASLVAGVVVLLLVLNSLLLHPQGVNLRLLGNLRRAQPNALHPLVRGMRSTTGSPKSPTADYVVRLSTRWLQRASCVPLLPSTVPEIFHAEQPVLIGFRSTHVSHTLAYRRGTWWCVASGAWATSAARNLSRPCTGQPTKAARDALPCALALSGSRDTYAIVLKF